MQGRDVRMTALKLLKLTSVPQPLSVARAGNLFIDHGVAQLVVQHRPDPSHSRRLEQFSSHNDLATPNVARGENTLLAANAPHHSIRVELGAVWEELLAQATPNFGQERVTSQLLPLRRSTRG